MGYAPEAYTGERFCSDIKNGVSGAYLLYGDEDYQKSVALERIRRKIMTAEGMEVFNYDTVSFSGGTSESRENAISKLSELSASLPMMQEQRLVEVRDIEVKALSADQLKRFAEAVGDIAEGGDTVLVIVCRANELESSYNLESTAVFKKLAAVAKPVKFVPLARGKLIAWIKKKLPDDVLLTDEGAQTLCEMCADSMYALSNECEKLSAYAVYENKKKIDADDVALICSQSPKAESPFAYADAAYSWKLTNILKVINDSFDMREEPILILGRLSRIYTDMLIIKCLYTEGNSPALIAQKLKMKEYPVKKCVQAIEKVPLYVIENAVRLAYNADITLKSTQTDPKTVLETLAARIYTPKSLMKNND